MIISVVFNDCVKIPLTKRKQTIIPQHPQYSAKPEDDLDKLEDMLVTMLQYGFIHEDGVNQIDSLMRELYGASDTMARDRFDSVENKQQFVQDFRNVIGEQLASNSYGAVTAGDIIGLRVDGDGNNY